MTPQLVSLAVIDRGEIVCHYSHQSFLPWLQLCVVVALLDFNSSLGVRGREPLRNTPTVSLNIIDMKNFVASTKTDRNEMRGQEGYI